MYNEKYNGEKLSDKELSQVYGGKGGAAAAKNQCPVYPPAQSYSKCPNPEKGLCEQCDDCRLK